MLNRSLWPQDRKHSFENVKIRKRLRDTLSKIDRLWIILLIQKYCTILNGNSIVHAPWNTKLYHSLKLGIIWRRSLSKSYEWLQTSLGCRYVEFRMCDIGNYCWSASLDEFTVACSRKARKLSSKRRAVRSKRKIVSIDHRETKKYQPSYWWDSRSIELFKDSCKSNYEENNKIYARYRF